MWFKKKQQDNLLKLSFTSYEDTYTALMTKCNVWVASELRLVPDDITVPESLIGNLITLNIGAITDKVGIDILTDLLKNRSYQKTANRLRSLYIEISLQFNVEFLNIVKSNFIRAMIETYPISESDLTILIKKFPYIYLFPIFTSYSQ